MAFDTQRRKLLHSERFEDKKNDMFSTDVDSTYEIALKKIKKMYNERQIFQKSKGYILFLCVDSHFH